MEREAEIRILRRISTGELERRWKALRVMMGERDLDFLIIQNTTDYLVPERKLLIFPISASGANYNPRNTQCIPPVIISAFLALEKIS